MAIPVSVPLVPTVIKPDGGSIPVVGAVKVVGIIKARAVQGIVGVVMVILSPGPALLPALELSLVPVVSFVGLLKRCPLVLRQRICKLDILVQAFFVMGILVRSETFLCLQPGRSG